MNKCKGRASTACLGVVADLDRAQGQLTVNWGHGGRQVLSPEGLDQLLLRSGGLVGHAIAPVRHAVSASDCTPALMVKSNAPELQTIHTYSRQMARLRALQIYRRLLRQLL